MLAFSLHLKSFGPSIPQVLNNCLVDEFSKCWVLIGGSDSTEGSKCWESQHSADREARKPNSVQSYQKTITKKLSWPILERCCIYGFTAYKAILMQVLLTNQWDPKPKLFPYDLPFPDGVCPSICWVGHKVRSGVEPKWAFWPTPIYCLSMNDDPHCRCLGVISDSLIFLFPHIELQILSFQSLDYIFQKRVNSNRGSPRHTNEFCSETMFISPTCL